MAEIVYNTKGVCSTRIHLTIAEGVLIKVRFEEGCDGNLQALSRLLEGMPVTEVIDKLKGIRCEGKNTSCPDQLALALKDIIAKK